MDLVAVLRKLDGFTVGQSRVVDPIYLNNGVFFLSVQASYTHYCSPRKTVGFTEYTHFEVLASIPYDDIPQNWHDDYGDGSGSLFAVVPKAEIETLLDHLNEKYGIYI